MDSYFTPPSPHHFRDQDALTRGTSAVVLDGDGTPPASSPLSYSILDASGCTL